MTCPRITDVSDVIGPTTSIFRFGKPLRATGHWLIVALRSDR